MAYHAYMDSGKPKKKPVSPKNGSTKSDNQNTPKHAPNPDSIEPHSSKIPEVEEEDPKKEETPNKQ